MILIGRLEELKTHSRYIVSLRSISLDSRYHSIVIYAIDKPSSKIPQKHPPDQNQIIKNFQSIDLDSHSNHDREWHAMEEECPHLGASMSEAQIDIEDDGVIAICPWHKLV